MQLSKNKTINTFLALTLLLTITITMFALPSTTSGEAITITRKAAVYMAATPNPIGVGQETLLHVGMKDELTTSNVS